MRHSQASIMEASRSIFDGTRPIGRVIRETVAKWIGATTVELASVCTAEHINEGLCADFADSIIDEVPGTRAIWPTPNHCVIMYEGRFYDSECPNGVDDEADIPFYLRNPEYLEDDEDVWEER